MVNALHTDRFRCRCLSEKERPRNNARAVVSPALSSFPVDPILVFYNSSVDPRNARPGAADAVADNSDQKSAVVVHPSHRTTAVTLTGVAPIDAGADLRVSYVRIVRLTRVQSHDGHIDLEQIDRNALSRRPSKNTRGSCSNISSKNSSART